MLINLFRRWQRLKYLYKVNPTVMIERLTKKIIAPFYRHEFGYITLTEEFSEHKYKDKHETKCIYINKTETLKSWQSIIPDLIPVNQLREHLLKQKNNCIILATRTGLNTSERIVVGYRILQHGYFSHDWGIKGNLPSDMLFVYYTEVLPEYRGQRINRMLMEATQDYCRKNRIRRYIGVIGTHNKPSITHSLRWKDTRIIGKIELFSLFGGFFKRATSWDEIMSKIEKSK